MWVSDNLVTDYFCMCVCHFCLPVLSTGATETLSVGLLCCAVPVLFPARYRDSSYQVTETRITQLERAVPTDCDDIVHAAFDIDFMHRGENCSCNNCVWRLCPVLRLVHIYYVVVCDPNEMLRN